MSTLSDDLETLSREAAIYLYPLVLMDITRLQAINTPADKPGQGPPNEFHHIRAFPGAEFRSVVRPNFDTLYSSALLDLTAGPVVVHAPRHRRPVLTCCRCSTCGPTCSPAPGSARAVPTGQDFVVVPPGYDGALPEVSVITAPTPYVWMIGRTQTNGPADYPAIHRSRTVTASPHWAGRPRTPTTPAMTPDEPLRVVNAHGRSSSSLGRGPVRGQPPHLTDFSELARLERLGIAAGRAFDATGFTAEQRARSRRAGRRHCTA